ncbi:MAG: alcohol dehydrogenase catalytic domain-containing protein [Tetrasphaera sp.]
MLVEIAAVGLCHTDIAVQHGHLPFPLPGVFGHEGAGTVVSVGPGVTKVAPGDKVALTFNSCGACPSCTKNQPAYCHDFLARNLGGARPDGRSPIALSGTGIGGNFLDAMSAALGALAHKGTFGIIGVPADPTAALPVPIMLAQVLGARIIGIVEGDSVPDEFIPYLARLNQEGRFPYDRLITALPFIGINDAIAAQSRGEAVKVVLVHNLTAPDN